MFPAGADRNNCFFSDPNVDWKAGLSTDRASGVVTFSSETHRKIRLYREQADDIDNNGHGTHTVASLLGSPFDISNINNLDYRCGEGSPPFCPPQLSLMS